MPNFNTMSLSRRSIALFCVAAALILIHALMLKRDLTSQNVDLKVFYLPWLQHILTYGRWSSLEGSFANYSPPYIYFLSLTSLLSKAISGTVLIKLVNVPFILVSGWLAFDICKTLKVPQATSVAIAALLMLSPEVWANGLRWGQADITYTCFLLGFYRLMLAGKPAAAMLLFGSAIAFKLQAIFIAPVLLALLLAGEIQFWHLLLPPIAYLAWMLPAAVAGRPWKQLLLVYFAQYETPYGLAVHVANPLFMLQKMIPATHFGAATKISILFAIIASLLMVWYYVRRPRMRTPVGLLTMMTLSPLVEAYLLPKMHDRYFFAGDVFAIILIAVRPAMWVAALLLQVSAYIVYRQFLLDLPLWNRRTMFLPLVMTTVAIALVARQFWREGKESELAPPTASAPSGAHAA
jgi:Gpi18-like mannosyltransferase